MERVAANRDVLTFTPKIPGLKGNGSHIIIPQNTKEKSLMSSTLVIEDGSKRDSEGSHCDIDTSVRHVAQFVFSEPVVTPAPESTPTYHRSLFSPELNTNTTTLLNISSNPVIDDNPMGYCVSPGVLDGYTTALGTLTSDSASILVDNLRGIGQSREFLSPNVSPIMVPVSISPTPLSPTPLLRSNSLILERWRVQQESKKKTDSRILLHNKKNALGPLLDSCSDLSRLFTSGWTRIRVRVLASPADLCMLLRLGGDTCTQLAIQVLRKMFGSPGLLVASLRPEEREIQEAPVASAGRGPTGKVLEGEDLNFLLMDSLYEAVDNAPPEVATTCIDTMGVVIDDHWPGAQVQWGIIVERRGAMGDYCWKKGCNGALLLKGGVQWGIIVERRGAMG